mgnify:CR=1 FL=1
MFFLLILVLLIKKYLKMKKIILLLAVFISISSCSNQVVEKEVNKKGGEWVSSGTKFLMGSDEQVEIVKSLLSNYAAMDAEAVFLNTRDTVRFFPYNAEKPVMMTVKVQKEMFSLYDSIISKPVYFLPYELEGVRSLVEVTSTETKYKKDGTVEEDLFLEKFIFGEDGKIHTVRQWRAAALHCLTVCIFPSSPNMNFSKNKSSSTVPSFLYLVSVEVTSTRLLTPSSS